MESIHHNQTSTISIAAGFAGIDYEERGAEPDSGLDTCPRKPRPGQDSGFFVACVRQQLLTSYVFVFL
jgi:hypothetical protein